MLSNGARWLKRGDTFDPECWRTSHRLALAASILSGMGVVAEWPEHAEDCNRHPSYLRGVCCGYRESVVCTCGRDRNGPQWPAWATDETFNLAYRLADEVQTKRGEYNRGEAYREKKERAGV